jgi:hypothetical protein
MSTMKTERKGPAAFAAIRFKGDRLEPGRVTEILHTKPTTAYHKGEVYKRDRRGNEARGRTGLWLLSSEGHVQSSDVNDHLRYLIGVLFPDRSTSKHLRDLLRDGYIEVDVPVFWHGTRGQHSPVISDDVRQAFRRLPAKIEEDFDVAA